MQRKFTATLVFLLFAALAGAQTYEVGAGVGAYIIPSRQNQPFEESRSGKMNNITFSKYVVEGYEVNCGIDYVQNLYGNNAGLIRIPISVSCTANHFFKPMATSILGISFRARMRGTIWSTTVPTESGMQLKKKLRAWLI